MKNLITKRNVILVLLVLTTTILKAQIKTLDEFENNNGWSFIKSDGVNLKLFNEKGLTGNAGFLVIDDKVVLSQKKYDSFGASIFDEGNIVDLLHKGNIPQNKFAIDQSGLANGVIKYSFHLNPGERTGFFVVVPFYGKKSVTKGIPQNRCTPTGIISLQ